MQPAFLAVLQEIRTLYKRPMIISSGYRSVTHSKEIGKTYLGEHVLGLAADILCSRTDALDLVKLAMAHDIRRIGINQKGGHGSRYIHLGITNRFGLLPEGIWTY